MQTRVCCCQGRLQKRKQAPEYKSLSPDLGGAAQACHMCSPIITLCLYPANNRVEAGVLLQKKKIPTTSTNKIRLLHLLPAASRQTTTGYNTNSRRLPHQQLNRHQSQQSRAVRRVTHRYRANRHVGSGDNMRQELQDESRTRPGANHLRIVVAGAL